MDLATLFWGNGEPLFAMATDKQITSPRDPSGTVWFSCLCHRPSCTVSSLAVYCFPSPFSQLLVRTTPPALVISHYDICEVLSKGILTGSSFSVGLCAGWQHDGIVTGARGAHVETGPGPVNGQASSEASWPQTVKPAPQAHCPEVPRVLSHHLLELMDQRDSDKENKTSFSQSQIPVGNGRLKLQLGFLWQNMVDIFISKHS